MGTSTAIHIRNCHYLKSLSLSVPDKGVNILVFTEEDDWLSLSSDTASENRINEMAQGPCAHLRCWDIGIVAWVMTNVVLDD
jgi:hypothetical protein